MAQKGPRTSIQLHHQCQKESFAGVERSIDMEGRIFCFMKMPRNSIWDGRDIPHTKQTLRLPQRRWKCTAICTGKEHTCILVDEHVCCLWLLLWMVLRYEEREKWGPYLKDILSPYNSQNPRSLIRHSSFQGTGTIQYTYLKVLEDSGHLALR